VVLVTSGPGATNAVTGITDALMDSIPMVVITGQVATHLIGSDAFQEADTIGITRHCTKHNYLVKSPGELGDVVHEAFHIATTGRPGPVVIDIPKDVQVAPRIYTQARQDQRRNRYKPQLKGDIGKSRPAVEHARRCQSARSSIPAAASSIPAPLRGRAAARTGALTGAPVTSTLMGLGAFPASTRQWLGMLGMHGTYEANWR
jgi:acetolactate synthase-1/2/3 large subunit